MAYVKTTWQTGDLITAAKLNNMENGISSIDTAQAESGLVVPLITIDTQNMTITMDMSFADVLEAIESNKCCCAHVDSGLGSIQVFNLDSFVPSDSTSILEKQFTFQYKTVGTLNGVVTTAQAFTMSIAFTAVGDKLLTVFTADGSIQIIPPPSNP